MRPGSWRSSASLSWGGAFVLFHHQANSALGARNRLGFAHSILCCRLLRKQLPLDAMRHQAALVYLAVLDAALAAEPALQRLDLDRPAAA